MTRWTSPNVAFAPRREAVSYIRNWTSSGGPFPLQSCDGSRRARYALRSSPTSTGGNARAFGVRLTKEWRDIAEGKDDGELFAAMLGRGENAVRLRQSAPFVGLLPKGEVRKLNEEAAG